MALVVAYRIAFVSKGTARWARLFRPKTVSATVVMTPKVLADGTPIYARANQPEVAIAESDGVPTATHVYWPARESAIAGQPASVTPEPNVGIVTRDPVVCRGGQYDGRTFSSPVEYPSLLVKDHVGGRACRYRRTEDISDGNAVFKYVGDEAPNT